MSEDPEKRQFCQVEIGQQIRSMQRLHESHETFKVFRSSRLHVTSILRLESQLYCQINTHQKAITVLSLRTHIWLDVPRCVEIRDVLFGVCGDDLDAEEDAGEEVDAEGPDEDQTYNFEQGVATVDDGIVLQQPVGHSTWTIPGPLSSHIPELPKQIPHKQ